MHALLQDVRSGIRQLFSLRGSSLVAVLTLALGIGVSSALFSVIHTTMLRPLPYPDPEQLVAVDPEVVWANGEASGITPSMQDMRNWQAADDVFSAVAGWGIAFRGRILDGDAPERLEVKYFTEQYLSMYGVTPILGRDFSREDCEPRAPLVALLGYGFWQSRYGGRPDVLGTTIRLDNAVATIVGVLPAWFDGKTPVALPLRIPAAEFARRGTGRVQVDARLQPGVTIEDAAARLTARLDGSSTDGMRVRAVIVYSQLERLTSRYRTTVMVLIGAVALIVALAAVNVAGLLLARGAARQRELDVRASLGASRGRLLRQLVIESVVLAIPAGVGGVALAWLSLDAIVANIPLSLPSNSPVTLNLLVLATTAALLVMTAIVCGLMPAIRLSRANATGLMTSSRQVGSAFSRRSGQFLIAVEIALAVILVTGAGLMLRSFWRLTSADLGFNADGLVTMQVMPIAQNPAEQKEYFRTLLQQLRTISGVSSATLVDNFALDDSTSYTDISTAAAGESFSTIFDVMPGYFETIGARLRQGRSISDAEYASQFRGVVINESAARQLFPGQSAVGGELRRSGDARAWIVVGVIADLRHKGPLNSDPEDRAQVFFPFEPTKGSLREPMTVVVRTTVGRVSGLADQMRRTAQSLGPRVIIDGIRSADELFTERVLTPRRRMVLLTLLAALGLVLALVGIFGTTAYAVTRRTAEIGLRMAIGARPGQVVGAILRDAATPVMVGTAAGLGGAALMTRAIESFLFETSPTDPVTLAGVAIVLILAGSLAALVPALRAASVDPASTLRTE